MAEGARLESVYTLIAYRGFESLSLRQNFQTNDYQTTSHKISNHAFFYKFANLGFN